MRRALSALCSVMALSSVAALAGDTPELQLPTTKVAPLTSFDAPASAEPAKPTTTTTTTTTTESGSIIAAWRGMPEEGSACGDDLNFDYGLDGGMRNIFCRALTVVSWKAFLATSPVSPWLKGPHQGTKLNFQAERDFGRYNPAFVRWATTALIPAATDPALRDQTRPVYDRQFKRQARLYFLV